MTSPHCTHRDTTDVALLRHLKQELHAERLSIGVVIAVMLIELTWTLRAQSMHVLRPTDGIATALILVLCAITTAALWRRQRRISDQIRNVEQV